MFNLCGAATFPPDVNPDVKAHCATFSKDHELGSFSVIGVSDTCPQGPPRDLVSMK